MPRKLTHAALLKRINRKLFHDGEVLRISRGAYPSTDLGRYYVVDLFCNTVQCAHVDLAELGRELGVLRTEEQLAE